MLTHLYTYILIHLYNYTLNSCTLSNDIFLHTNLKSYLKLFLECILSSMFVKVLAIAFLEFILTQMIVKVLSIAFLECIYS